MEEAAADAEQAVKRQKTEGALAHMQAILGKAAGVGSRSSVGRSFISKMFVVYCRSMCACWSCAVPLQSGYLWLASAPGAPQLAGWLAAVPLQLPVACTLFGWWQDSGEPEVRGVQQCSAA